MQTWKYHILLFLFPLIITGCGTTELYRDVYAEKQSVYYFLSDVFVPEIIVNAYRMRDFISSEYFGNYKRLNGDLKAIDETYNYARWLTDDDIPQSLFIITFSTLPYKRTPAKIPIVNLDMMFYFSMETDSSFKKRFENLPSHFLTDSPEHGFGDKDKLPHFFGSAYLSHTSDAKVISKYIGDLIEIGEAFFSLEGYYDERDRKTNSLGADFGLRLLHNYSVQPSQFLQRMNK